ncbi:phospholipase A [Granulosicoccus antarcticus]|uniref:Phospholipase A1 n=1 Tax=Granulosicoccus antarcticus IMCC3135 TaxID=1192854 RepID=A0A2Z2P254_9GAMM|nr:phospholipase A [Granulosicoccus antarcticus]ASJ76671.1 Putative phospholipase A1 [Granulosicoccus antarcticus IMCC3135]
MPPVHRHLLVIALLTLLLGGCASIPDVQDQRRDLPDAGESKALSLSERKSIRDSMSIAERQAEDSDTAEPVPKTGQGIGAVTERVKEERASAFNPYVLTAHKHNFILPMSYSSNINEQVYSQNDVPLREGLLPVEVKFQISLKSQLNEKDMLLKDDALSLAITLEAWWQLYSSDLSSPFRETNYAPEIFYMVPLLWGPFGGNTALVLGLEHQSNGQVQGLSRSWNRVYTTLIYERGRFVASIRPWYRIPEDAKENPEDAEGDDNPDILDFMGHGEIGLSWRDSKNEYAINVRGNTDTGKGAVKIGWTFPLFAKFRGFVQYFNGYGDSLIDYNHYQQRLGLGVALTNLF